MQNDHFGQWLKSLRQKLSFSQEELSQRLGVSVRTVQRWESMQNRPVGAMIEKLVSLGRRHGIIADPKQLRIF